MSETRNVLPELSFLMARASDALQGFRKAQIEGLTAEQRQAVSTLIEFVREYDSTILETIEPPG
jgi:hypothetical protein